MNRDYDYCDTYDSYYNGITLDNKNEIKTFSCKCCNKPKLILKKRDMWIYPVSDIIHGSDLVTGTVPRTMWVFGFCITREDLVKLLKNK